VNLIHSVLGEGESVTQAHGCLRHGAGRGWEVTLHNLLPSSFASRLIMHNSNILVTVPFRCDRKAWAACAQSFALWQQATIEFTQWDHSRHHR